MRLTDFQNILNAKSVMACFLRILCEFLALILSGLVRARAFIYKVFPGLRTTLPGTTVSIGNLVLGGGGKTPFTIAVARYLLKQGARPAILTRGYKSGLKSGEVIVIQDGKILSDALINTNNLMLDEPLFMSHALRGVPVIVGNKRAKNAQIYLQGSACSISHWLLDDGFQHLSLNREIDIVLFKDFHFERDLKLFPRGVLREPMSSLKRAQWIGIGSSAFPVRGDFKPLLKYQKKCFYYHNSQVICDYPELKKESDKLEEYLEVVLACAIAENERFLYEVKNNFKVNVIRYYSLSDHTPMDFDLLRSYLNSCKNLVITVKDYYRDPEKFQTLHKDLDVSIFVLSVDAVLDSAELAEILGFGKR